jgi:hypothetical protein
MSRKPFTDEEITTLIQQRAGTTAKTKEFINRRAKLTLLERALETDERLYALERINYLKGKTK